ncbi:MAG: ABC transporter permease [Saprospiraceae bacterium]|nr:ABC transporter permease [Saprospiraceae bacterium]
MFRNYIKIAIRNLVKHKTYSIINVAGLAIGIASFIIILLYIFDELSYDRYHKNADNIYRVVNVYNFNGIGERSSSSPLKVGPTLELEYPEIVKSSVRFYNEWGSDFFIEYKEKKFKEKRFFYVDSTVFDIFDIPFILGDPKTALSKPFTIVITKSTAERYFGDENPIGKVLRLNENDHLNFTVTGVIEDAKSQSHIHYDFLASFSTLKFYFGGKWPNTWVWNPFWTYLLLEDGVSPASLNYKFPEFVNKYFYDAEKDNVSLHLQKLTDIHLKSDLDYEIEPNGRIGYIQILTVIAFFILIIACINFVNIATALSSKRAKEIGVKKVFGAFKRQLIIQFISEAVVLTYISIIIALMIVELVIPGFNSFTGKNVSTTILLQPRFLVSIIVFGLFIGILSGLYPAFYLSSFHPINIFKGVRKSRVFSTIPRKALVILQFTISVILIIWTITTFQQLNHLRNTDIGFNKNDVIVIPTGYSSIVGKYSSFKKELLQNPNIENVTAADYIIGQDHNTHEYKPDGFPADEWQFYPTLVVRDDFVETFDIEIVAGRDYDKRLKTDRKYSILINEAMVQQLGWKTNENALGKKFNSQDGKEKVIGVFKDLYAKSQHNDKTPLVINLKESDTEIYMYTKYIFVRIRHGSYDEVVSFIENKWKSYVKERPFEQSLLCDELSKLYNEEENLGKLAAILTILIIFVAGLGLFGLVSFMAEQRTKEIGIRKVLGASTQQIVILLTKEFAGLVAISIIIGWPIAYFGLDKWLENFSNRISINLLVFLLSGLIIMIFAITITMYKSFKAARQNPVDSVKSE